MVGKHVLINCHDVIKINLATIADVEPTMRRIIRKCDFHVVGEAAHQFEPHGVTISYILSESSFTCHTWPEKNLICIDVFCCAADFDPYHFIAVVQEECSSTCSYSVHLRG